MRKLFFDIETNGLMPEVDTIWCVCTAHEKGCSRHKAQESQDYLKELEEAEYLIGHNIIGYDLPVLKKIHGWQPRPEQKIVDTLLMSQFLYPDISLCDVKRTDEYPKSLIGSHSLEAWGHRLNFHKGEYGKEDGAWEEFTPEMMEYCANDVALTMKLFAHLMKLPFPRDGMLLEHVLAADIQLQIERGFRFNADIARTYEKQLRKEKDTLEENLQTIFPPTKEYLKTPQYYFVEISGMMYKDTTKTALLKKIGKTGRVMAHYKDKLQPGPLKFKEVPFNPNSRKQIVDRFIEKYDWKPEHKTDKGNPKLDEEIMDALPFEEAPALARYLTLSKHLGQLADGDNALLKCVTPEGRIHGGVNTLGTVSHRASHSSPNLGQIPKDEKQFRECFLPSEDMVLVGCDASGLELRMLAHYLEPYDGGRYKEIVLEGDVHTANQEAAGLASRDMAKTFIYAFIYGAGLPAIATTCKCGFNEARNIINRFYDGIKGLRELKQFATQAASGGQIEALDGRMLPVRSDHLVLNLYLQSAGAIVCKRWLRMWHEEMRRLTGIEYGRDWAQVVWVHDEHQFESKPDYAESFGQLSVKCIKRAGKYYDLRIPLDGEYKIGYNWAETH